MAINENFRGKNLEVNDDGDGYVNEGQQVKKREKKKKSKEERVRERRVVFWTLLVVLVITFGFWLMPRVRGVFRGERLFEKENKDGSTPEKVKPASKNYIEITL